MIIYKLFDERLGFQPYNEKARKEAELEFQYFHVDCNTGNDDTGNGSIETPYRTINKAISLLGDIRDKNIKIILSEGTHEAIVFPKSLYMHNYYTTILIEGKYEKTIINQNKNMTGEDNNEYNHFSYNNLIFQNFVLDFSYYDTQDKIYFMGFSSLSNGVFSNLVIKNFKYSSDVNQGFFYCRNVYKRFIVINCIFIGSGQGINYPFYNYSDSKKFVYLNNYAQIDIAKNMSGYEYLNENNVSTEGEPLQLDESYNITDPKYKDSMLGLRKTKIGFTKLEDLKILGNFSNINPTQLRFQFTGDEPYVLINDRTALADGRSGLTNEEFTIDLNDYLTNSVNPVDISGYKFIIYKYDNQIYYLERDLHINTSVNEYNTDYSFKNGYTSNSSYSQGTIDVEFPTFGKANVENITIDHAHVSTDVQKPVKYTKSTEISKIGEFNVYKGNTINIENIENFSLY